MPTRAALAAHVKAAHGKQCGWASLADLKRMHTYLHRTYQCNHDHTQEAR